MPKVQGFKTNLVVEQAGSEQTSFGAISLSEPAIKNQFKHFMARVFWTVCGWSSFEHYFWVSEQKKSKREREQSAIIIVPDSKLGFFRREKKYQVPSRRQRGGYHHYGLNCHAYLLSLRPLLDPHHLLLFIKYPKISHIPKYP